MKKDIKKEIMVAIVGGVISAVVGGIGGSVASAVINRAFVREDRYSEMEDLVKELSTSEKEHEKTISKIETDIRELRNNVLDLYQDNKTAFSGIDKNIEYIMNISGIDLVIYTDGGIPSTDNKDCFEFGDLTWAPNEVIGVGAYDNQEYTPEELTSEPVIFVDKNENYDLYTYGRINDNENWDGDCLVNIYENGELSLVTEGYYEDGKMIKYRQAQLIHQDGDGKREKWSVSDRIRMGDYNDGVTTEYFANSVYRENTEYITSKDMISIDALVKDCGEKKASFYKGRTSDGKYNDTTGEAYFVKYASDGTVITLYNGNFTDGVFNDRTGNAWEIAREETVDEYIYYKGTFDMGERVKSKIEYHVTRDDVLARTQGQEYECEIVWK